MKYCEGERLIKGKKENTGRKFMQYLKAAIEIEKGLD